MSLHHEVGNSLLKMEGKVYTGVGAIHNPRKRVILSFTFILGPHVFNSWNLVFAIKKPCAEGDIK